MENPIIARASEKFEELFNKIFVINLQHQAFTADEWNKEVAPIFREIKKLITDPFNS